MRKLFRALCFALGLLVAVTTSAAGVFIVPTGTTNILAIPSGEAIFISYASASGAVTLLREGLSRNQIFPAPRTSYPYVFAGPAELVVNSRTLTYEHLRSTNVYTAVVTNGWQVIVPAGVRIHFFGLSEGTSVNGVVIERDPQVSHIDLRGGEEFDGPVSFSWRSDGSFLLSYLLTQSTNAISLPNLGAIGVPAGSSTITVEKSTDLTNWVPVIIQPMNSVEKEFYRIQVNK